MTDTTPEAVAEMVERLDNLIAFDNPAQIKIAKKGAAMLTALSADLSDAYGLILELCDHEGAEGFSASTHEKLTSVLAKHKETHQQ